MDISSGETGMREWNPRSREVLRDQVGAYDALRERCPVAHSDTLGWSLLRHSDVLAALADPGTYSSRVSRHVAVPNGMDPPEHTEFRQVVDDCFTPELVEAFAPELRALTDTLVGRAVAGVGEVEIMSALALPFAAQAQCAYLGWPPDVADALVHARDAGFALVVITNQSGIGLGLYGHEEVQALHDVLARELATAGVRLDGIYYCPHHPSGGRCLCRKPGSLLLERAIARHGIDPVRSIMIGDRERDVQAAEAAGVRGVIVESNAALMNTVKRELRTA